MRLYDRPCATVVCVDQRHSIRQRAGRCNFVHKRHRLRRRSLWRSEFERFRQKPEGSRTASTSSLIRNLSRRDFERAPRRKMNRPKSRRNLRTKKRLNRTQRHRQRTLRCVRSPAWMGIPFRGMGPLPQLAQLQDQEEGTAHDVDPTTHQHNSQPRHRFGALSRRKRIHHPPHSYMTLRQIRCHSQWSACTTFCLSEGKLDRIPDRVKGSRESNHRKHRTIRAALHVGGSPTPARFDRGMLRTRRSRSVEARLKTVTCCCGHSPECAVRKSERYRR